jgi:branched-chain amino acid transport system ATP-binding protein
VSPAGQPILEIEGLTAGYDGAAVLRSLDLTVADGEVVALLGANGAGKTTTLRVASGLVRPMRGSVRYDGHDVASLTPPALVRLGLAHVPEGRGIFYGLTVAEHFRLRAPGQQLDVERALEYFPALKGLQNRRVGLLSGGEQQMLSLAHALSRRPRLLLLDELSLGLAPVIVERLLPIVRRYAGESGAGVLLVEQDVAAALEVADRGIVLAHGEVTTQGDASTLRSDRNLLVASYLGGSAEAPAPPSPA